MMRKKKNTCCFMVIKKSMKKYMEVISFIAEDALGLISSLILS
jgi:hypothetical protein